MNSIPVKKIIIMVLIGLNVGVISSCATKYQAAGFDGWSWSPSGYAEMALKQDTYVVSFNGNSFTGKNTVQNYLLRRCAELSLNKGYKYFAVLSNETSVKSTIGQTPTTINVNNHNSYSEFGSSNTSFYGNNASGYSNFMGNSYSNTRATINPGVQYQINRFTSRAIIKLYKKNVPEALDAKVILSNFSE